MAVAEYIRNLYWQQTFRYSWNLGTLTISSLQTTNKHRKHCLVSKCILFSDKQDVVRHNTVARTLITAETVHLQIIAYTGTLKDLSKAIWGCHTQFAISFLFQIHVCSQVFETLIPTLKLKLLHEEAQYLVGIGPFVGGHKVLVLVVVERIV